MKLSSQARFMVPLVVAVAVAATAVTTSLWLWTTAKVPVDAGALVLHGNTRGGGGGDAALQQALSQIHAAQLQDDKIREAVAEVDAAITDYLATPEAWPLVAGAQLEARAARTAFWKTAGLGVAVAALTGGLAAPYVGGAIGSYALGLSGAAASNAGLAVLGGGTVAAGGMGMAGGAAVVAGMAGASAGGVFFASLPGSPGDLSAVDGGLRYKDVLPFRLGTAAPDRRKVDEYERVCRLNLTRCLYIGEFKSRAPDGFGQLFHFSTGGIAYNGTWAGGQMHGEGVLFDPDGAVVYRGRFKNGTHAPLSSLQRMARAAGLAIGD